MARPQTSLIRLAGVSVVVALALAVVHNVDLPLETTLLIVTLFSMGPIGIILAAPDRPTLLSALAAVGSGVAVVAAGFAGAYLLEQSGNRDASFGSVLIALLVAPFLALLVHHALTGLHARRRPKGKETRRDD